MARSKKKKDDSAKAPTRDPLQEGIHAFDEGDYVEARRLLADKANDDKLSEAQREQAKDMISATLLERGALLVGLACAVLYVFALVFTGMKQP